MSGSSVELGAELAELLGQTGAPVARAARELIVLELYRRGAIGSGKAAALLGLERLAFIQWSGDLGIPYFRVTDEDWAAERETIRRLSP